MVKPIHPLQLTKWGEFREKTGLEVIKAAPGFQMSIHPLPKLKFTIGYIPKGYVPTKSIINRLLRIGKEHNCIFIKLEPNVLKDLQCQPPAASRQLVKSPHPFFAKYSFYIDLTKPEEVLLKNMKSKTRYNIKVAKKHGVTVKENNSDKAFETYIQLSRQTWKRKGFYGHGEEYHRTMWNTLHPAGIAHLLIAEYKNKPVTAWILFLHDNILYYPYGASSGKYKYTMASNLMMWEAVRWGKENKAVLFDLWGCLGPNPDKTHPWYGFHRFKEGYGGKLVEYIGSYDLVIKPFLYNLYNIAYPVRQKLLGLE